MKRRIGFVLLLTLAFMAMTGCGISSTGLSDAELDQVAEYTAKLLLKHTRGYTPTLIENIEVKDDPNLVKESFGVLGKGSEEKNEIKPEEMTPKEEFPKEPEEKHEKGESEQGNRYKALGDLYQTDLEILYGGSGEYKRYPENEGYFSLVAPEGRKLFVAKFLVKNKGKKTEHFVHEEEVRYSLEFKNGNTYKPSVTLLEQDMKFLDVKVEAGKTMTGVVVFTIPKEAKLQDASLRIYKGNGYYELSASQ